MSINYLDRLSMKLYGWSIFKSQNMDKTKKFYFYIVNKTFSALKGPERQF